MLDNTDAVDVIALKNVTKNFILRHNRAATLRASVASIFQRNRKIESQVFTAVDDVSLTIRRGDAVALMGPNGSGKSTLLQIIAGILNPSKGDVITQGIIAPLIKLGVGFHPELTGEENILLNASLHGLPNSKTRVLISDIVEFSEIGEFIDTPVKNYSSGMYVRLGFSVAVHLQPDILLADEILAVGDSQFREKCLKKITELRSNGMTLILVSHSMEHVKQFCERFFRLEAGKIVDSGELSVSN